MCSQGCGNIWSILGHVALSRELMDPRESEGYPEPSWETALVHGNLTVAGKVGAGSPGDPGTRANFTLYEWRTCRVVPDASFR